MFGTKNKKYSYIPILRYPEEDEDKPKEKKNQLLPYIKVKLKTSYPDGKILTGVIVDNNGKKELIENINCIDDFAKYVCFRSEISVVLSINKLWAQQATIAKPNYGITLKVLKVRTKLPVSTNNSLKNFCNSMSGFLDSDSDDEKQNNNTAHQITNTIDTAKSSNENNVSIEKINDENDENDGNDENDENSDVESE
jgi:hypothetical protein